MSPVIIQPRETQPDANDSLKRKVEDADGSKPPSTSAPPTKILKTADEKEVILKTYSTGSITSAASKKARETRLEQNRKAARESRRRKKVMIEDLQRSVIFFSRANGALKHQNDDLTRLLMQAQAQVSVIESNNNNNNSSTATSTPTATPAHATTLSSTALSTIASQDAQAESTSEKAAAPAAPLNTAYPPVPTMQPGATMQAMASFQQAAAAAMKVAVQGMQGISPGASLASLAQPAPTTGTANAQQAFNDTMTALAMQQAAIAAAAVPPHLMAQIVGTTPAYGQAPVAMAPASGAPVPVVPWPSVQTPTNTNPQGPGEQS